MVFRCDYEVPLKVVMDYPVSRPKVDTDRVALMRVSLGGYLTPLAWDSDSAWREALSRNGYVAFHQSEFTK